MYQKFSGGGGLYTTRTMPHIFLCSSYPLLLCSTQLAPIYIWSCHGLLCQEWHQVHPQRTWKRFFLWWQGQKRKKESGGGGEACGNLITVKQRLIRNCLFSLLSKAFESSFTWMLYHFSLKLKLFCHHEELLIYRRGPNGIWLWVGFEPMNSPSTLSLQRKVVSFELECIRSIWLCIRPFVLCMTSYMLLEILIVILS